MWAWWVASVTLSAADGCMEKKADGYRYTLCPEERKVYQYHSSQPVLVGSLAEKVANQGAFTEYYTEGSPCEGGARSGMVTYKCCDGNNADSSRAVGGQGEAFEIHDTDFISAVRSPRPCYYELDVCSAHACTLAQSQNTPEATQRAAAKAPAKPLKHVVRRASAATSSAVSAKQVVEDAGDSANSFFNVFFPNANGEKETLDVLLQRLVSDTRQLHNKKKGEATPVRRRVIDPEDAPTSSMSRAEILQLRAETVEMFEHASRGYMEHAYPAAELMPLTCKGGPFTFCEIPGLTLIDYLDTFAVMGDAPGFQLHADLLLEDISDFNIDVNVSVFETNIRALGGLLGGHILAVSPPTPPARNASTGVGGEDSETRTFELESEWQAGYQSRDKTLLTLAVDLADRLLKAFDNNSSIPYGTVNLRHGVPPKETPVASVAGAGSLSLEFVAVSLLTGDPKYARAALLASKQLFDLRSGLGLVGKHVHSQTHEWVETGSGIGTNADSFYEYLLKVHIMTGDESSWDMFEELYEGIMSFVSDGDWYPDVEMSNSDPHRRRAEGLLAFWPGLQVLIGDIEPATRTLNALMGVWRDVHFLPEGFQYVTRTFSENPVDQSYLLRPELIESLVYIRRATGDNTWLHAGKHVLQSLQTHCKTVCGYSTVSKLATAVPKQDDSMPSFFLSETVKYLYVLFDDALTDEGHWLMSHSDPWVLSTEAHAFPVRFMQSLMNENVSAVMPDSWTDRAPAQKVCPTKPLWLQGYDVEYVPNNGATMPSFDSITAARRDMARLFEAS
ncbi:Alpha-mannosidase I MNS4 [Diplonema papillatum]|nr:Alpha-mannosidase I MNS4 [Diplonema papillatum]